MAWHYLFDGFGIFHDLNEPSLWASGHAAIWDQLQIQSLLLPELNNREKNSSIATYIAVIYTHTEYLTRSLLSMPPIHAVQQNPLCSYSKVSPTFSKRENILRVIISCLRSSPSFRMSRMGLCLRALGWMLYISSHIGLCMCVQQIVLSS